MSGSLRRAVRRCAPCTNARGTSGRWTAAALVVLAPWLWSVQSAAADDAASLRALADAARTTLAERIEPPVAHLPFLCTVRRTETAPMREYILRQQAEAIEALLASASAPAEAKRVRRLLDELQRDGYAREADARLADTTPGGAAGLRLAASLGELPAALHERLRPGGRCGSTYVGMVGRTLQPLGALARADYQRLTELEPADPWHALVLAWLAGIEGEAALQRALPPRRSMPSAENAARADPRLAAAGLAAPSSRAAPARPSGPRSRRCEWPRRPCAAPATTSRSRRSSRRCATPRKAAACWPWCWRTLSRRPPPSRCCWAWLRSNGG